LALAAVTAVFYRFEQKSQLAQASVERTLELWSQIRQVLRLLLNMETGTRSYLLTGRGTFLKPYRAARKELPKQLDAAQTLVRGALASLAS